MRHNSCASNDIYSKPIELKQIDVEILKKEKNSAWLWPLFFILQGKPRQPYKFIYY